MAQDLAFYGTIIHSISSATPLVLMEKTIIIVKNNRIVKLEADIDESSARQFVTEFGVDCGNLRILKHGEFLIPGFVDTHLHAPQYVNVGVGYHLTLLDWLNKYTFPAESKFSDLEFAQTVYDKVVKRTLKSGTTTACYFATIHLEASLLLADIMVKHGQRGYVGKVCMDQNSPDNYVETTQEAISRTEEFIQKLREKHGSENLVDAIITPRFAISCTDGLMSALAALAKKYNAPIQTHMSENSDEIKFVLSTHEVDEYVEVYRDSGLLTDRTILAHCVHSSDKELDIIKKYNCGIAHCPNSNTSLASGLMNAKKVEKHGVKMGLGESARSTRTNQTKSKYKFLGC